MVYIYALCDVFYNSFYIEGLKNIYGKVEFNTNRFPKFVQGTFAILIVNKTQNFKIIIDPKDENNCNEIALEWCDVYGKVNFDKNNLPKNFANKIKPIGPSFGIKIWGLLPTTSNAISNFLISRKNISNKREFFANYWRQYKRLPIKSYSKSLSDDKYVYFIGSLWSNEKKTNTFRAAFITNCLNNKNIDFEGGFAPRNDRKNFGFEGLILDKVISLQKYILNIKKSSFVFNTPAVLDCHGWKLGEFMALGKAIISTQHTNDLPSNLVDDQHVLYADNAAEIKSKIDELIKNKNLRHNLENNARQYYDEHLAPEVVIKKLLLIENFRK
ncbi:MAG: glycosyltransferase [Flavobacterium sp.]|nr:glycosyltransferase [Flavobacterium sp.]